jgi:hypothetical protein
MYIDTKLNAVITRLIQLTCADKLWWEIDNDTISISQLKRRVYTTRINNTRVRIRVSRIDTVDGYTDYSIDFTKAGKQATREFRSPEVKELVSCINNLCFSETDTTILLQDFLETEIPE